MEKKMSSEISKIILPFTPKKENKEMWTAYHKEYYCEWYKLNRSDKVQYLKNRRKNIRIWIEDIKKQMKCSRCGFGDYRAIVFHHIGNKDRGIADMVKDAWSKKRILEEIKKCIPLCANCHYIEHYFEKS